MRHAQWSDNFFNYVPAINASDEYWSNAGIDRMPNYRGDKDYKRLLRIEAIAFCEANPTCSMNPDELVEDFVRRL